jgi:hypothetical protein
MSHNLAGKRAFGSAKKEDENRWNYINNKRFRMPIDKGVSQLGLCCNANY